MPPELVNQLLPILLGGGLALLAAIFSVRTNRMQRLMTDTPTSKSTGVFIGFNELKGRVVDSRPLTAFLSGASCIYYRYSVKEHWSRTVRESYTDSNGKRRTRTRRESGWRSVDSGSELKPFFLEDSHGIILVRPTGAELEAPSVFHRTCRRGDPLYYGKGPPGSVMNSDHRRLFTEEAICIGDPLYVLGQARERQDIVAAEIAVDPNAPSFLISTRSEEEIAGSKRFKSIALGLLGAVLAGGGVFASFSMFDRQPPPGPIVLAVLGYAILWILCWGVSVMNSIIGLRNRVRQAYSLVDVQLKRRADLIPRLVETVRTIAGHEQGLQVGISELRSGATETLDDYHARSPRLLALAEDYPEIATGENFLQLQEELSETEERIALARSYYNEMASFLNIRRETVPDGLFAKIAGVGEQHLYEILDGERAVPEVKG